MVKGDGQVFSPFVLGGMLGFVQGPDVEKSQASGWRYSSSLNTFPSQGHSIDSLSSHARDGHVQVVARTALVCQFCHATLTSQRGMELHIDRFHRNKFRFRCEHCGKGFVVKDHYEGHMNMHSNVRVHQCPFCAITFAFKSGLRRHVKKGTCRKGRATLPWQCVLLWCSNFGVVLFVDFWLCDMSSGEKKEKQNKKKTKHSLSNKQQGELLKPICFQQPFQLLTKWVATPRRLHRWFLCFSCFRETRLSMWQRLAFRYSRSMSMGLPSPPAWDFQILLLFFFFLPEQLPCLGVTLFTQMGNKMIHGGLAVSSCEEHCVDH